VDSKPAIDENFVLAFKKVEQAAANVLYIVHAQVMKAKDWIAVSIQ